MSIAKKQDSLSGASNPGKVRGGGVEAPGGGVLEESQWPEEKHALGKEAEGGMGRAGAYTFLSPWVTLFFPRISPGSARTKSKGKNKFSECLPRNAGRCRRVGEEKEV